MRRFRGSGESLLPVWFSGATILLLLLAAPVMQAQSAPTGNSIRKSKPTISAESPGVPQEAAPPPVVQPPPPSAAELKPPQPPAVAWDGSQLTIDAENSTLASILIAVRERTGASIDIPGGGAAERVFIHLGPGPARDIISSLLYGTPYDYIIEASDDDPDTLRSVVLTPRGLGDSSADVVVAGTKDAGNRDAGEGSADVGATQFAGTHRAAENDGQTRGVRMMPGWASPQKPVSQAEGEAVLAAQQAAAQDGAAAAEDSGAAKDPATPAPDSATATAAEAPEGTKASNSSSNSDSSDQSGVGQAIQSMTKMFEQRRQIQSQQNQPPSPPSSN